MYQTMQSIPFFPSFRRKSTNVKSYTLSIRDGYEKHQNAGEVLFPEFSQHYPHTPNWYWTASGTTAYQAILAAVSEPGDVIHHTVFGWAAFPGAVVSIGRKLSLYPCIQDKVTTEVDMLWLKANHMNIKVLTIVHLWGDIIDIKPIRDVVGDDCIIIEDCAQCPSLGENMELNTGKYSDFCVFSWGFFKSPGSIEDGGALCYKDDSYNEFFDAYFASGIPFRLINDTKPMAPTVAGTKDHMSIAEAAVVKEDIKILRRMGAREIRTANALSYYESFGIDNPMPNNKIFFACPIRGVSVEKRKKLWDLGVQYKNLPDFRHVPPFEKSIVPSEPMCCPDWRQDEMILLPTYEYLKPEEVKGIQDILNE